jgi:hypothetical protein
MEDSLFRGLLSRRATQMKHLADENCRWSPE